MEKKSFKMIVKTLFGLEEVLADELKAIGAEEIEILNRAVAFTGSNEQMYKANYFCRTALRILMPIGTYEVKTQEDLYKQVSTIDWSEYMEAEDTLAIDSVITATEFTNSMFVSMKAKDAIADQFRNKTGKRPSVDLDHPTLRINIHIHDTNCTVSLDSSGSSLHKRGYRSVANKAPLNEVLAAGLVLLSGWDKKSNFVDGMCGSGTILIEAGLIAKNVPAGYFRKEFGFERWKNFDQSLWESIIKDPEKKFIDFDATLIGIDSAKSSIRIAKENLRDAALRNNNIELISDKFEVVDPPQGGGTVILNPPYGERMDKDEDIFVLYKRIGDTLKSKYPGYTGWLITSNREAAKNIGLKPSRKITIYNGPLECRLLKFDMYGGSKRRKFNPEMV